jgi:hypothetical protein
VGGRVSRSQLPLAAARLAPVLIVAAVAWPLRAGAQPDAAAQKALATKLFNEGKVLMTGGQIAEACARLEESQRLDPAPGTLLNLAFCHEKLGKTATAWAEYCDARVAAQRDGRDDRVAFADEHARTLEPQLSHLTISVPAEADLPDLLIRRDGSVVPRSAWATPLPIDPGDHLVEASAGGRVTRRTHLSIGSAADTADFVLARLDPAPVDAIARVPVTPSGDQRPPDKAQPSGGRRWAAVALAAGGALSMGAGAYFGLRAMDLRKQSDPWCPFGSCTARGAALNNSASLAADLSDIGFAIGVASLAAAGYLAVTARRAPTSTMTTAMIVAMPAVGGGSADLVIIF